MRRFVLLLVLMRCAPLDAALREMAVVPYGPERGLSGHPVTALAQDRAGRIWIGTWGGGVFRYDGLGFRPITSRDGLLSDRVLALLAGARGEMWVASAAAPGAEGGLTVLQEDRVLPVEGARWESTRGLLAGDGAVWLALRRGGLARHDGRLLERIAGLDTVLVRDLAEDREGRIWIAAGPLDGDPTAAGSLFVHDGKGLRPIGAGDGLPRAPLNALLAAPDGALWLATGAGLYRREGNRVLPATLLGDAVSRPLNALSQDAAGRVWLAGEGSVTVVDRGRASELRLPSELGPVPVLAVEGSPAGGVFLATATHLLRLEGRIAEVLELEPAAGLLAGASHTERLELEATLERIADSGRRLLADHEGGMWAVSGRRVIRYAGDEARRFGRDEGLANEDVRAVLADSKGYVWAGTAQGLGRFDPALGHFEPVSGTREAVTALYEDRGGAVYAATPSAVLRIAGLSAAPWGPGRGFKAPTALAADAEGNLWIGSQRGLARMSAEGLLPVGAEQGLPDPAVLALASVDEELWVGLQDGLAHRQGERFETLPALAGQRVIGLAPWREGDARVLLAVTPRGLRRVPGGEPAFGSIERTALAAAWIDRRGTLWQGLELGLAARTEGAEVVLSGGAFPAEPARAFAEDSDGRIWFATSQGLFRHAPRRRPPSVRIDSLRAGGAAVDLTGGAVQVAGECRSVEIGFSGVSFIGPRDATDLRFETRLLPLEKDWTHASFARARTLEGLAPARYTFEVRARSRDLLRSEPARLEIALGRDDELPAPAPLELPAIARP